MECHGNYQDPKGVRDAYDRWAETYDSDRNATRDLDQIVCRSVIGGRRYRSILEIGCGTGKNTAMFAAIGQQVWAVDISEGMIAKARSKLHADNVSFVRADVMRPWPHSEQSMDLVACSLVLEHVSDLSFVFAEAFRVLTKNGQLFICELHPFRQYQGAQAAFVHGKQRVAIAAFVHHLSDFVSVGRVAGFALEAFHEWWDSDDRKRAPRLVSFFFRK